MKKFYFCIVKINAKSLLIVCAHQMEAKSYLLICIWIARIRNPLTLSFGGFPSISSVALCQSVCVETLQGRLWCCLMSPSCVQWDTGCSSSSIIIQESRRHLISQFVHSVQNHSFIIEVLLSTEAALSPSTVTLWHSTNRHDDLKVRQEIQV